LSNGYNRTRPDRFLLPRFAPFPYPTSCRMSLLKADLLVKLRENDAEMAADHKPILYLGIHFKGKTFGGFLLTRIKPEHRKEACSLIDFVV
jgi:hypothetical protein